ncbi:MAG: hypothetical protein EBZ48_04845 [Proteobacteria bacterium]|nr:hypothetical protein [Pseudomonadota bacterium]
MQYSRRTCIGAVVVGVVALTASSRFFSSDPQETLAQELSLTRPYAPLIGERCARALQLSEEALRTRLAERIRFGGARTPMEAYESAVTEDINSDRIISVDGWPVSQTEAAAYALSYLRSSSAERR